MADAGDADGPEVDADEPGETEESDQADGDQADAAEAAVYGVEITALYKGTAAKEGLEVGDVILSFNGTPTPTFEALTKAVASSGSTAQVVVIREGDDDDETETVTLYPQQGRIGLSGERVQVNK
jgi:S1-C subfamily serine protease